MQGVAAVGHMHNVLAVKRVLGRAGRGSHLLHPQAIFVIEETDRFAALAIDKLNTKGVVSLKRGNSFFVQKKHSDYENPNACGRM